MTESTAVSFFANVAARPFEFLASSQVSRDNAGNIHSESGPAIIGKEAKVWAHHGFAWGLRVGHVSWYRENSEASWKKA